MLHARDNIPEKVKDGNAPGQARLAGPPIAIAAMSTGIMELVQDLDSVA